MFHKSTDLVTVIEIPCSRFTEIFQEKGQFFSVVFGT